MTEYIKVVVPILNGLEAASDFERTIKLGITNLILSTPWTVLNLLCFMAFCVQFSGKDILKCRLRNTRVWCIKCLWGERRARQKLGTEDWRSPGKPGRGLHSKYVLWELSHPD